MAQPRFYYDLASPESYLVAERALHAVGEVPEWIPVRLDEPAYRCEHELDAFREDVARRARVLGLMEIRWPDGVADEWAMLAATSSAQRNGPTSPRRTGTHSGTSPSAWLTRSAAKYATGEARSK